MKMNVGIVDRDLRLAIGAALILLGFLAGLDGMGKWVLIGIGALMVLVAVTRICPAYLLFGVSTCGRK